MLKLKRKYMHIRNKMKHHSEDDAYNVKLTGTISTAAVLNMKTDVNIYQCLVPSALLVCQLFATLK